MDRSASMRRAAFPRSIGAMLAQVGRALRARPATVLVIVVLGYALAVVLSQPDFVASDPLWYADVASGYARDPARLLMSPDTHPFNMRIGLTVPLAVIYRVFGVSTTSSNAPAILAALGVLVVVYAAGTRPSAKLWGLALAATCIPVFKNAEVLNVDLPCAALMSGSVLCLSRRSTGWLIAGMALWFFGFLVKETALWCAPVWIYAAVGAARVDGVAAAARRFAPALLVGALLGALYMVVCARIWGSPLARFHGIDSLDHAWSLHGHAAGDWIARLTWQPIVMFLAMLHVVVGLAVLGCWLVPRAQRIWVFAMACFVGLYWFGSVALTSYTPLPISERMILPIVPPVLVVAAAALDALRERLGRRRALVAVIALAALLPGLVVLQARIRRPHPETDAFALLRREVTHSPAPFVLVCGEPRCLSIAAFHFALALPANLTVVHARDFAHAPRPAGATVRALVNATRAVGARSTDPDLDWTRELTAAGLPRLAGARGIFLYDAGDGAALWTALQARRAP